MVTRRRHGSGNGKVDDTADDSSREKELTAADTVDEWENDTGCDQEDDVLDGGRVKCYVSRETGHFEDVDNVVHGNVATKELLPHLNTAAANGALPHVLAEKTQEGETLRLLGDPDSLAN